MYSKIHQVRKISNASTITSTTTTQSPHNSSAAVRRSLRKGVARKRSFQMQMASSAQLRQLSIELEEGEVCFAPGDVISGFVLIGVSLPPSQSNPNSGGLSRQHSEMADNSQCLEIVELKMRVHGAARVKGKNNRGPGRDQTYLNMEADLIGIDDGKAGKLCQQQINYLERLVRPGAEKIIKFEIRLPPKGLCTSLESKSASILYAVRVALKYKNLNQEVRRANAVRGFTMVERFDVARLPNTYFQPASHHLTKKFGLFSCTGGQIRLHFSINRSAFVSGENIVIEGRIENRTDRRVDKVAAVLQQVVVVQGAMKAANLNLLDVVDIHEDNLALFVDQGTVLRIERNFALPPLPPSTYGLDGLEPEIIYAPSPNDLIGRNGNSGNTSSRRYRRSSSNVGGGHPSLQQQEQRFVKVLYQICIRVTTGGVEVMEINVPIIIGSLPQRKVVFPSPTDQQMPTVVIVPHRNSFTKAASEAAATFSRGNTGGSGGGGSHLFSISMSMDEEGDPMALFIQNRKEAMAKLGQPGETYICNKSELNFTNKYPFFINLPTSSKQSRKVSILANAIRAESSFLNALREEHHQNQHQQQQQKIEMMETVGGKGPMPVQQNGDNSEEGPGTGSAFPSRNSSYDPIRVGPRGPLTRRQSTLPPVEVLVEHFRRSSVAAAPGKRMSNKKWGAMTNQEEEGQKYNLEAAE